MDSSDLSLRVGNDTIKPTTIVPDLGVLLDSEFSLKNHISKIATVSYFHLCRLKAIQRILGRQITTGLVNSFVLSRFDYCNSVLTGLRATEVNYRSIAVRRECCRETHCGLGLHDHVTSALHGLHWLPIEQRVTFKLCTL